MKQKKKKKVTRCRHQTAGENCRVLHDSSFFSSQSHLATVRVPSNRRRHRAIHDLRESFPLEPLNQGPWLGESGTQRPFKHLSRGRHSTWVLQLSGVQGCGGSVSPPTPLPTSDRGLIDSLRFQNRHVDSPFCTPARHDWECRAGSDPSWPSLGLSWLQNCVSHWALF